MYAVVVVVVIVVVEVKLVIDNSDPLMLIAAHVSCSAPLCCFLAPPIGLHVGFVFVSSHCKLSAVETARGGGTIQMLIGTSRYKFYPSDIRKMIVISAVKHKLSAE